MKTNPVPNRSRIEGHPQGFALITTISIMVLLALIAIGLLSLSAVTVRSSSAELAQLEAKANARMALMIALGELQRELGPDQRVSAEAGVMDATPDTLGITGVEHPHWTAVWTTKWDARQNTPWVRNDREGGLRDLRLQNAWDREKQVKTFLVSGNEGGKNRTGGQLPFSALNGTLKADERVRLVGEGTLGNAAGGGADSGEVYVQGVKTKRGARVTGSYAWWVSDLGTKANLHNVDPHRAKSPSPSFSPTGMQRMLNAPDSGDEYIDGLGKIDDADAGKSVTDQTLALASGVDKEGVKSRFHDVTTYSRSVLANVRDGGLQRDLTAYLNSNGSIPDLRDGGTIVSPGIKDLDNMVGPANSQAAALSGLRWTETMYHDISPVYALLRKWAQQAANVPFQDRELDAQAPEPLPGSHRVVQGMRNNTNVYDNSMFAPATFLPYDTPNMVPVMVEGSIYYNMATYPQTPNSPTSRYVARMCMYPRIALWNPYNVEMKLDTTVAELFVNGNKRIRLRDSAGMIQDIDIPIGRGAPNGNGRHPAHYRGTILFTLQPTTLKPGETLIFAPDRAAAYEHENIFRNTLTVSHAPSPDLYYWQDMVDQLNFAPIRFLEAPEPGTESGADNYLMALKDAGKSTRARGRPTDTQFDELPLIVYINPSLQAGGADELPVTWGAAREVPVHVLGSSRETIPASAVPDTRTRDGFRLRWWTEHVSNIRGAGQLANAPQHFQTAAMATWNLRAAYFCRTPFDNVSSQPPYFYGVYTRDLFDPEVSFDSMKPRAGNRGFPFGPPVAGPDSIVLFEVPRAETGVPSLGYLRHLKLSEFGWHTNYAVGNSLVDPRVGRTTSSPLLQNSREKDSFGWNQYLFGWADGRGATTYWAQLTREIIFETPQTNVVVYDQSFELNYNLWDDFFVSTGTANEKRAFLEDPGKDPLPNGRMGLFGTSDTEDEDVVDFHRAALQFALEGGFNVNSISKEAWKAILSSTGDTGYGSSNAIPFPRVLNPPKGEWLNGKADSDQAMAGFRSLSDEDLDRLATELVAQVKLRAPFFGLADFVNRRLFDDETGLKGPIQAAIDTAGLNAEFEARYPLDNTKSLPRVTFDNMSDATRLEQTEKPKSVAWGLPGFLTQGDVMQVVGSTLRARSDTFMVRAYGESVDGNGKVQARAWCEAVVQRTPEPLDPDSMGLNPIVRASNDTKVDFGRRFRMVTFRWMSPEEV